MAPEVLAKLLPPSVRDAHFDPDAQAFRARQSVGEAVVQLRALSGGLSAEVVKVRAMGIPMGALRGKVARSLFGDLPLTAPIWMQATLTETGVLLRVPGLVLGGLTVLDDGVELEVI